MLEFIQNKKALLLDMNSTFMFGEDNFDESVDYSFYYKRIGGRLTPLYINNIINDVYDYLNIKYSSSFYYEDFPSLEHAIQEVSKTNLNKNELQKIIDTFSFYEQGYVPEEYIKVLVQLNKKFILAGVFDIWSPKDRWINYFNNLNITSLFTELSFSSDIGIIKPSPIPFKSMLSKLNLKKSEVIVIGDNIDRDLAGAHAAEIDCILVNGSKHNHAQASFTNLIDFNNSIS